LKLGKHQFEYDITDAFFDEFEYSLVKRGDLKCRVELDKQETMLILTFDIKGSIFANCDRCLAQCPQPVIIHEQQIAKFSSEDTQDDEEIIILTKNDHEIDISGLIYEYINVALPLITVCIDEGKTPYCDKETLESLSKLAVNTDPDQTDPRWDALKKLN
jgi:uncharacterized metal-binding protein YceD (DUF177 family)